MTTLEGALERRAGWDTFAERALRYARSCRNREKRAYAIHYGYALALGEPQPDSSLYALGYMGAQAVRLELCSIMREVSRNA